MEMARIRRGAPFKKPALRRTEKVTLLLTAFEKEQLAKHFEQRGLGFSEGIRQALAACMHQQSI